MATSRYRWVILAVCWLCYVVAMMPRLSIGPLAPFLKKDLNLTGVEVGLFMSTASIGWGISMPFAGWLADHVKMRWLLLTGGLVGGGFVASLFTASTFTQGLVLMGLAGLGMGFIQPTTTKAVLEWFPLKERATAMGFKQTAPNIAGVVTASVLPAVALASGWQYGFLGIGLISVLIGGIAFILFRQASAPGDPPAVTATVAVPRPSARAVFASRDIWLLMLASCCLIVVDFGAIAYFVLYLEDALFLPVITAGFFLALLNLGGAFGKPLSGFLSDRLFGGSRKRVLLLLTGLSLVGALVFVVIGPGTPYLAILLLSLVFGFGSAGWGGLHLTLTGEFAGKELVGTVTGLVSMVGMLANAVGPPVFGLIVDRTGSYRGGWVYLAVLSALALLFLLFIREDRRRM